MKTIKDLFNKVWQKRLEPEVLILSIFIYGALFFFFFGDQLFNTFPGLKYSAENAGELLMPIFLFLLVFGMACATAQIIIELCKGTPEFIAVAFLALIAVILPDSSNVLLARIAITIGVIFILLEKRFSK